MKFQSIIQERGTVSFPAFTGERTYMHKFTKKNGLPNDLKRWQSSVDQLLDGVDSTGSIYLMIDQGVVTPTKAHRREGLHIDGYWNASTRGHYPQHRPIHTSGTVKWEDAQFQEPEGIILASDVSACIGYHGEFEGPIKEGGDCSHIDLSSLTSVMLKENVVYGGNITCLHESIPIDKTCQRTLVRLNIPGWSPS